jgi:hypothetical protein
MLLNAQNHKVDSLIKYYNLSTNYPDSSTYKESFYNAFPNDFNTFIDVYGYKEFINDKGEWDDSLSLLYDVSTEHINLFFSLYDLIDKSKFYKKLINISLNGYWEADGVNVFQGYLNKFFMTNIEGFLTELETYDDYDIKSFWHFFFAALYYDHPYWVKFHQEVYDKIKPFNTYRLLDLMEEQYQKDYKINVEEQNK